MNTPTETRLTKSVFIAYGWNEMQTEGDLTFRTMMVIKRVPPFYLSARKSLLNDQDWYIYKGTELVSVCKTVLQLRKALHVLTHFEHFTFAEE